MMYFNPPEPKKIKSWHDLHRKIGQIIVITPTDSDIQEGDFREQLLFRTEKELYLIEERSILKEEIDG